MKINLKLNLVLFFLTLGSYLHAQQFANYQQEVPGEPFKIDLVAVTGGQFTMGAGSNDTNRKQDEKPAHNISVDSFWMGKFEITWEQYDAFVYGQHDASKFKAKAVLNTFNIDAVTGATTPYTDMSFGMGKTTFPAVNMTQYAALMYCKWLTAKTGVFFRLPTEAEWEYVCKKGQSDKVSNLKDHSWFQENSQDKYALTGSKKPNKLGIHDMLGNVSEWVLDQYSASYYQTSPKKNPWNKPTTLYPRVVRGGSWKDTANKLCCTSRQASKKEWKQQDPQIPKSNFWHTNASFIGFRVVRPKIQPSKEEISAYWLEAIEDYGF